MAGKACDRHISNMFKIEIPGFPDLNFAECSPLEAGVEVEEDWSEGGILPDKTPGMGKVEDVTLKRGTTADTSELDWMKQVADFGAGTGAAPCDDYKRDCALVQLDRNKNEVARYNLFGAFPNKIKIGEWKKDSKEKIITELTLSMDYWERA